jgi:choline kinase
MSTYILLSAGSGRAMQSKGARSLLTYNGLAVIDHQIATIQKFDKKADIVVVTGVGHEKIIKHIGKKDYDVRILFNYNYKLTSQTESLRLAFNAIRRDSVYIIHGDIIFNGAALCSGSKSHVVMSSGDDKKSVGVLSDSDGVVRLSYGLQEKWGQIAYLSKKDFQIARDTINSFKNNKMTFEYINMLLDSIKMSIIYDGVKVVEINKNYEDFSNNI